MWLLCDGKDLRCQGDSVSCKHLFNNIVVLLDEKDPVGARIVDEFSL